jgi:hypothetical protein
VRCQLALNRRYRASVVLSPDVRRLLTVNELAAQLAPYLREIRVSPTANGYSVCGVWVCQSGCYDLPNVQSVTEVR